MMYEFCNSVSFIYYRKYLTILPNITYFLTHTLVCCKKDLPSACPNNLYYFSMSEYVDLSCQNYKSRTFLLLLETFKNCVMNFIPWNLSPMFIQNFGKIYSFLCTVFRIYTHYQIKITLLLIRGKYCYIYGNFLGLADVVIKLVKNHAPMQYKDYPIQVWVKELWISFKVILSYSNSRTCSYECIFFTE